MVKHQDCSKGRHPPRPLGIAKLCLGASFRCTTLRRRDSCDAERRTTKRDVPEEFRIEIGT
jgi:hypothetical protein